MRRRKCLFKYTKPPQYRSEGFKTWITRITLNKAIDMKRKLSVKPPEQLHGEHDEVLDKLLPGRRRGFSART